MKKDIKHYFVVGGILCGIAASSALLIGLTNVLTAPSIEKNNIKKEQKALKAIYSGDDVEFGDRIDLKGDSLAKLDPKIQKFIEDEDTDHYLSSYWDPKSDDKYGYIFKTTGKDTGGYGAVTMLVEIDVNYNIGKISVLENTESFASTVQEKYVDKYNNGSIKIDDVKCGATYGATLIKNMSYKAQTFANVLKTLDTKEAN